MPKGRVLKREAKKPKKKKDERKVIESLPAFNSPEVEVVRKRKRRREEE